MIVVDTNVIAYLAISGEFTKVAERVLRKDSQWTSPILWQSELSNVLMVYVRKGILDLLKAQERMNFAMQVMGEGTTVISQNDVLALAAQSTCSSYDCEFVALAQSLGVPLVTNDKRVLKDFPGTAVSLAEFADRL